MQIPTCAATLAWRWRESNEDSRLLHSELVLITAEHRRFPQPHGISRHPRRFEIHLNVQELLLPCHCSSEASE